MSPEATVAILATIVTERREFSEEDIYSAMSSAGIPDGEADRAFKFTQTAWGRALLAGLGIRFSPEYSCLNASGQVIESGHLEDEAHYAAAWKLAPQYQSSAGFQRLALMSAEFRAINELLNRGSKAKDLATSPTVFFLEAPIETGMQRARQSIAEHTAAMQKTHPNRKPWWRFW